MDVDQFGGRTDDDLFSDDFEPATAGEVAPQQVPAAQQAPAAQPAQPIQAAPQATKFLAQSRHKRPDRPPRSSASDKAKPKATANANVSAPQPPATTSPVTTNEPAPANRDKDKDSGGKNTASATSDARLGSGANPRTKLTETELAAKMEQMRILSAEKTRRFELTQRDESEHAVALAKGMEEARRRRAEEAQKRRLADEDKRRMENERAKNRERKLHAMGMKEGGWDEGKEERIREEDQRGFRSAHGGVRGTRNSGLAGSRYAVPDALDGSTEGSSFPDGDLVSLRGRAPRDRRPRGERGGRVGQRGGHQSKAQAPATGSVPKPEDFPTLPQPIPKQLDTTKVGNNIDEEIPLSPAPGRWADEVAAADTVS
ncbi:hypothetical protein B0T26DRAFT_654232 [Lasiosphaeria miniovina]|uniref:Uncharacterized protein n=1 Tax=Lasiosphaeria miniovina TaxID=1954250 RepID=A0AA40DNC1_9PEZI|nr:uncharacterized protein B0T26DRAFT_654232 [Lasiosphaeria miniovina]KAK0710059.1 hypothetical protein B0T26DRAFT_654232 [Lasiosphaeria miniovina]